MNFPWFLMYLFVIILSAGMHAEGGLMNQKDTHQSSDLAELNQDVDLSQNDADSAGHGMVWQALHIAAAAACRGIIATTATVDNAVVNRDSEGSKSCNQLCAEFEFFPMQCAAEVSITGYNGKATENGQLVGLFNNHKCDSSNDVWGGNEASAKDKDIVEDNGPPFSFCCCRMP